MSIGLWTQSAAASIERSPLFTGPVVLNPEIV